MARTYRKLTGPTLTAALLVEFASAMLRGNFSIDSASPAIANGTTAGRLRTTAAVTGKIAGVPVTKASTDDLWNLSAQTATGAAVYRAFWLYIDGSGAASIGAGADAATAALALAALPTPAEDKCIFGVYVAGPSTTFTNALAAQGTIHNGIPSGAKIDSAGNTYLAAARLDIVTA